MKSLTSKLKALALSCLVTAAFLPAVYGASADLSIPVHSHNPAEPPPNSYLTYSFTIHNNSPTDSASNVTVTVAGTGPQFFDSGSPYFFVNNGDNTFTATVGTIAAGGDAPFTVKYFVQTGAVTLTATVSSPDDPNSANDSATESANQSTADLEMTTVNVSPEPGQVGELRTYQGTLTNLGPDDATNVTVAISGDSVNSQGYGYDAFESFDHSVPPPSPPDPDQFGFRYLPVGNIPAGHSVTFTAYYNAIQTGSFTRNFIAIAGAEVDPNVNNNYFPLISTIGPSQGPQADLAPIVGAATTVTVGSNITYTFNTFNLGPDTASNVMTSFKPSSNETFVSASVPFTVGTGTSAGYYFVNNGDLPGNVGYTFTFVFQASEAGAITLTGDAFSDTNDPNSANDNFTVTTTAANPTPPPRGGLSPTYLTIDGSASALPNLKDTVLRFAAVQTGNAAALYVRVQYSTTAGVWNDLDDGNHGFMTYDPATQQYILSTLKYPLVNGVSFRAVAAAPGYDPDSTSNTVGVFDLASSLPRLTPPVLNVTGNGPFADLYFRAQLAAADPGVALRIQSSSTPTQELSWVDLNDGNSGQMTVSDDATRYFLMANNIPAVTAVYFRVLSSKNGFADGISAPKGPFDILKDTPPTIKSITVSKAISGGGTIPADPILVEAGPITLSVTATPGAGHNIKNLSLRFDGGTIASTETETISQLYTTTVLGDHIVEATAADELGGTSRYGTHPTYIRVIPAGGTALKREEAAGTFSQAAATTAGNVYTLVKSNGLWSDASSWTDASGKNGVPGPNDLAVINQAKTVMLAQATTVRSISLDGQIYNVHDIPAPQVTLTVTGLMTVSTHGADILNVHLVIDSGATCEFLNNDVDCFVTGSVENDGKFNLHGSKGIVGLLAFVNNGTTNFQIPLAQPSDAGQKPDSDNRVISTAMLPTVGLLRSDLQTNFPADGSNLLRDTATIVSKDGAGVVSNDGATIVSQGGGNLISPNGSNIVSQGGGNLISPNGSNIVSQGGGNLVGPSSGTAPIPPAAPVVTGFIQSGGETDLSGINVIGDVVLNGGVLAGTGVIYGSLTNNSGYILPGQPP